MLREEKKVVIKAIASLGHRVTAADVASTTGLSLSDTTSLLNTIASEAGGHLEVSQSGDIAYRFKNTFQSVYLTTGIRAFFGTIMANTFGLLFYLLKISFGIFLFLSLIIVVTSFIVIAVLSSQFGGDREEFNLIELLEFFNFLIFRDLIFGGAAEEYRRVQAENNPEGEEEIKKSSQYQGNFFVNCFSFLFGEGNPNTHLDEEKWQLAAQAIRENGGVVIKEQLAPYIGPELDDADTILPVLARFDGRPVVTARGNIAYIFPSLQVTSDPGEESNQEYVEKAAASQSYLAEERWKFSQLPKEELRSICIVAALNVLGTIWMYFIFNHVFHLHWEWTQLMVAYGALFIIIPLIRQIWQTLLNHQIDIRNFERHEAAKLVSQPDREIKAKLGERQEFALAAPVRAVPADHLVFTSEKESLDQQFKQLGMDGEVNSQPDGENIEEQQ